MENRGFERFEAENGLVLYKIPRFEEAGCKAVFTSRVGGFSAKPYSSLNLGFHVGDSRDVVVKNREAVCEAMGWSLEDLVCGEQVHGENIFPVAEAQKGRGARDYESCLPNTDALVTDREGVVLGTFYADCVPVFIFDQVNRVVALAHAGWKGSLALIAAKTIAKMSANYQTNPKDCLVAIGPSVGPCCYEVEEKLLELFKRSHSWWEGVFKPTERGKWSLDLWQANRFQILVAGIREENLITARICTSCNNNLFFSYRREDGCTGRMGAFISLAD